MQLMPAYGGILLWMFLACIGTANADGIDGIRLLSPVSPLPPFTGSSFTPASFNIDKIDGDAGYRIFDLTDQSESPSVIGGIRAEYNPGTFVVAPGTTLFVADDIDFGGKKYVFNFSSPSLDDSGGIFNRRVFIIADTLRLSSDLTLALDSPPGDTPFRRRGGDVTIFANTIQAKSGAKIVISANGANGRDAKRGVHNGKSIIFMAENGGAGGSVVLASKALVIDNQPRSLGELRSLVSLAANTAAGGKKIVDDDVRTIQRPNEFDGVFLSEVVARDGSAGPKGTIAIVDRNIDLNEFGGADHDPRFRSSHIHPDSDRVIPIEAVCHWQVKTFERWFTVALEGIRTGNRSDVVLACRKFGQSDRFLIPQSFQTAYADMTQRFDNIRSTYILPLWHRRESVIAPSGLTRQTDLFVEGASLMNYVAPTEVLLHCYQSGSKQTVGFLTTNAAEDEVTLLFDTEMTIPDWLEVAIRKKLAASNEELSGVFYGWKIDPVETAFPNGVKRVKVSVLNETWRWEVTLDGNFAPLLMTQFASTSGIPFSFDWKYSGSDSIEGRTFTVRPSLARRREATLKLENGLATNTGTRKVSIEYVRIGKDDFHVLSPPLSFDPGETKAIPLPAGTDPGVVTIPVASLVHASSAELTNAGEFLLAEAGGAFETLTIENLIPARLQDRQQSVRYIEIQVEQLAGSTEPFEVTQGGVHKLGPESVPGSVKSIKFLRPQGTPRRYRLSGHIEYLGGGHQTLATKVVDSLNIDIDESWLPQTPN